MQSLYSLSWLHSSFRCNRDAKELCVPCCPASIINAMHNAIFTVTSVRTLLPRPLVWTNADLFILFSAGVPQVELIRDVATDGIAFAVEQGDAVCARSVEPVI